MNQITNKGKDSYLLPVFSLRNKVKRLFWNICWIVFCRLSPTPFHRYRCTVLRLFGAKLGKENFIYPSCRIWAPWNLITEDVVTIGPGVEIYNPSIIKLGHHTILSQDAYLCGATHDYNSVTFTYLSKGITTEPYVWICARSIVLPGVLCQEGSVLGAGSVTSRNLERWSVYVGSPATFVKYRKNFVDGLEN